MYNPITIYNTYIYYLVAMVTIMSKKVEYCNEAACDWIKIFCHVVCIFANMATQ